MMSFNKLSGVTISGLFLAPLYSPISAFVGLSTTPPLANPTNANEAPPVGAAKAKPATVSPAKARGITVALLALHQPETACPVFLVKFLKLVQALDNALPTFVAILLAQFLMFVAVLDAHDLKLLAVVVIQLFIFEPVVFNEL